MQRPGWEGADRVARTLLVVATAAAAACAPEKQNPERSRTPAPAALPPANGPRATAAIGAEDGEWSRPAVLGQGVRHDPTHCREFNQTPPVQGQHQAPTDHRAQPSIGLTPVPGPAQPSRKPTPAQAGVLRDELLDELDFCGRDVFTTVTQQAFHALK